MAGSECDDYIAAGVKCGTDPRTDDDCNVDGMSVNFACDAADDRCNNIFYQVRATRPGLCSPPPTLQSRCGAYTRFGSAGTGLQALGLFAQREIFWKEGCSLEREVRALFHQRVVPR